MTANRLDPLLKPKSMAFVGASTRVGMPGNGLIKSVKLCGYSGAVYPVNPKYEDIEGLRCYPSLAALPEAVDLAVLCVNARLLEDAVKDAIACKARALAIFDNPYLDGDTDPPLVRRIQNLVRDADVPLLGANCLGYFNLADNISVNPYAPSDPIAKGGIFFITHSGMAYGCIPQSDERLAFSHIISSGQELNVTMADYLHFALDQDSVTTIALFMESVRDPARFHAALERARAREIPVVAIKVGRTEKSARLAVSHSGAIAGDDAAYEAVFARHGVLRVDDMYEMAQTLTLLSRGRRLGPGGLAAIGDSGGERGLIIDLAGDIGVPFAQIGEKAVEVLRKTLAPGLPAENPVDAWGGMNRWDVVYHDCLMALMHDPDTAIGFIMRDMRSSESFTPRQIEIALEVAATTDKPVCMATNYSGTAHREIALRATDLGIPVLDGTRNTMIAVRRAMDFRDFLARPPMAAPAPAPAEARAKWRARLAKGGALEEEEALALLADYAVPVPRHHVVSTWSGVRGAAESLGYPVVLKTAMPGILHKTERRGVKLGLADESALKAAYDDLALRLGPKVLVAAMAEAGVELALGIVSDAQFGPLVMVSAGGVLIEILADRALALPPFDEAEGRRILGRLKCRPLLDGKRGQQAADLGALVSALARFSVLADELGDLIAEMDVNPLRAGAWGALALDAIVVPRGET